MSDIKELSEAEGSTKWYANGTIVICAPTGNVFDVYTPERAALIVALRNGLADGSVMSDKGAVADV